MKPRALDMSSLTYSSARFCPRSTLVVFLSSVTTPAGRTNTLNPTRHDTFYFFVSLSRESTIHIASLSFSFSQCT